MTFTWPLMLISLFVVPLLVWLYVQTQRRRQRLTASYGTLGGDGGELMNLMAI